MSAYRKASIRQLATEAYQLDGQVLTGRARQNTDSGRWMIGDTPLEEWLARYEGQDLTCILISSEEERPMESRICQTCGREYVGTSCPYCREVRLRLRGH